MKAVIVLVMLTILILQFYAGYRIGYSRMRKKMRKILSKEIEETWDMVFDLEDRINHMKKGES